MQCMKCNRKMDGDGTFCPDCLAEMEKYPVKINAPVQLPVRTNLAPPKKKHRFSWDFKPEEQLRRQKLIIRCLCAALAVAVAAFLLSAVIVLKLLEEREENQNIGQNYGTASDSRTT